MRSMGELVVGYVQTRPRFGEVESNVERALNLASKVEADLLVFPELFNTGYLFESREEAVRLSEGLEGPTVRALAKFAAETSTALVAGFAELDPESGQPYNSAVVVDGTGDVRGVYRKVHLFNEEKVWFEPGDLGFRVFNVAGARVGVMICFDWFFPESARVLALSGAQIIAHPANLVLPYAQTAMLARSIENRVFTVTANRVGEDARPSGKKIGFTGQSQVTSPGMEILVRGPRDREHVAVVTIDPGEADDKRVTERNDLFRDRRPDLYGPVLGR